MNSTKDVITKQEQNNTNLLSDTLKIAKKKSKMKNIGKIRTKNNLALRMPQKDI